MMMDFIMIAVLAGCFGLVGLFISWCQKQMEKAE